MNCIQSIFVCFLLIFVLSQCAEDERKMQVGPLGMSSLEKGFAEPPVCARPRAYWDWVDGNFDLSVLSRDLEAAKAMGMGGFDIWDVGVPFDPEGVVPPGPAFLGSRSMDAIGHVVRKATQLDLELGLVAACSWNSGGSWVPMKYGAKGLFRSSLQVRGPATIKEHLEFPELPETYGRHKNLIEYDPETGLPVYYREVAVLAWPDPEDETIEDLNDIKDISALMDEQGLLSWEVPEGEWTVTRYVCVPTGQPLMQPSPNSNGRMIDHFSAEAQEFHLNFIIEKLREELGSLGDNALKYLYNDSYEVNTAVWTDKLPETFEKKSGYSLIPWLPVLDGKVVVKRELSDRFLFDLKKVLSDMIIENHYIKGKELCGNHGMGYYAEAGGPGPPVHNVPFEDLKALGAVTVPRGEFWYRHPRGGNWNNILQIVKGVASAAHIYDQTFVEAESFTSVYVFQEGPADLKPLADRAFCEGLNRIVYHTYPHIPPEAGQPGYLYNFGTLVYPGRAWWPKSKPFHEYLGRSSYLLQQGIFVGDVAYYYGDRAPNFTGWKTEDPSRGFGYDYDVINTQTIMERLSVKDGKFYIPHGQYYEVIVLPDEETMKPEVLAKLKEFVQKGGMITGRKPSRSYRLNNYEERDRRIRELAGELWGSCDGERVRENAYGDGKVVWGKSIRDMLLEKGVVPDLQLTGIEDSVIDFIHRRTGLEEIYFIRNKANKAVSGIFEFRVKNKKPQLWDPLSACIISRIPCSGTETGTGIPLSFDPFGSCFIVFRHGKAKKHIEKVVHNGKEVFPEWAGYLPFEISGRNGDVQLLFNRDGRYEIAYNPEGIKTVEVADATRETVIKGPWEIRFPHGWRAPAITEFPQLISWTESEDEGIRHFSGIATYYNTITVPGSFKEEGRMLLLDLGMVHEVAELYVNGKPMGISWHPPYVFDITEAVESGDNHLVIEVANLLNNRLIGDAKIPEKYRQTKSNVKRLPTAWKTPMKDAPLRESGLMGPVKLISCVRMAQ